MIICILGLLTATLLIAVLSQKLVLNRSEKYLFTFISNSELANEHKEQAANVIKYAIKLWIQKRTHTVSSSIQSFRIQRKLFESINAFTEIKQEEKASIDNCVGPIELIMLQRKTNDNTNTINQSITEMKVKVDRMEEQLSDVKNTILSMQNALNIVVNELTKEQNI